MGIHTGCDAIEMTLRTGIITLQAQVEELGNILMRFALLESSDGPTLVAGDDVKQRMDIRSGDIRDAREALGLSRGMWPKELVVARDKATPHSAGRRVEKLEVVARKLVEDSTPYAGADPQYALVDVRLIEDLSAALDEA